MCCGPGGAITIDVSLLALFKYSRFFGLEFDWLIGPIGIPLAISFYTFHITSGPQADLAKNMLDCRRWSWEGGSHARSAA